MQVNIAKRNVIEQIPIRLPQLETQRKIVGVLNSIDEKIKENEKINNNLVAYRLMLDTSISPVISLGKRVSLS